MVSGSRRWSVRQALESEGLDQGYAYGVTLNGPAAPVSGFRGSVRRAIVSLNMANPRDIRVWFLMRGVNAQESYVFIQVIAVDRSGPGRFTATIIGTDGRIVAVGQTEDEAADEALELFKGMIDHCIDVGRPLENVLGKPPKRVPFPISKSEQFFGVLDQVIAQGLEEAAEDDWAAAPATDYLSFQEATV